MAQTIEQGDIFGRIGKSFGEGFSGQYEDSMKRNQLANVFDKIEGIPKEIGKVIRAPGGREALPNVLPYIQARGASQRILDQAGVSSEGEQPLQSSATKEGKVLQRPERLSEDPEILSIKGAKRQLENPLRFPTVASAIEYEAGRAKTQQNQITAVRQDFDKILETKIQKGGTETYKDVLGDLQEKFKAQAEDAVLSGKMTDKEAARYYGDKALDFAKARNKFTVPGRDFWSSLFTSNPLKEVRAVKKAYDDVGESESFINDLVSRRKFSLPIASELAKPPTSNAASFFSGLKQAGFGEKNDQKVFSKAFNLLTPKDSLQAFASQLRRKGYSPQGFLDYVASTEKEITPFQERELQESGSFEPSLSDILYFTMTGKKP